MFLKILSLVFLELRDKYFLGGKFKPKNKPWMRYREIEIIKEIFKNLKPTSCLEWGAGYSSLFFPTEKNFKWISVEHQEDWAKKIQELNSNKNVEIFHIPANNSTFTDEFQDGSLADFKDYIEFPQKFAPFDFILIDGRARIPCIEKSFNLIKPNGIVLLHDANRKKYHKIFNLFPNQVLFFDHRETAGGIWIGSKEGDLTKILNVEKHLKLWKFCRKIGKKIRC